MVVIKPAAGNEVSYDPSSPISVMVEINQAIRRDNVRTMQDDTIIATAPVIVIGSTYRHLSQLYRVFIILLKISRELLIEESLI